MAGQKVGYIRVSSNGQNTERQLEGYQLNKIFTEKISGKDTKRQQLNEMISYIREGDCVYVHSLDRLGRSLIDLQQLIDTITDKGCEIHFSKENLTFGNNTSSPMNTLLFQILGSFAEFERKIIKTRQQEGIRKAQHKGIRFGREKILSKQQESELFERVEEGYKKVDIARDLGISKQTLYNYIKRREI